MSEEKIYKAEFTKEELIELLYEQKHNAEGREIDYLILNFTIIYLPIFRWLKSRKYQ